ncbi:S8 family serine peptidase [Bacteroides finegoldii]|jgi:cell wall-associated protease|uniref:S8 family serine peptidase n=1 Tax=Bacteroides finegoldii TaxID=338188 RepID=UPI0022E13089|nr:S8 family serine peptidase [Bacteroides finegoldii]
MGKFKLPIFLLILLGISVNNLKGQTTAYSNWYKVYNDTLQGINMEKALHFLQEKKLKPHRQIIVGIIDSGIDTTSVDLAPALWCNPKEKNDGKDNDKNGYADDLHGWNFLGTKDGAFNMTSAGTEEYREFKRLYPKYKNIDPADIQDTTEYAYYEKMKKKAGIMSYIKYVGYTAAKDQAYQLIDSVLTTIPGINIDTLTVNGLTHLPIEDPAWGNAYQTLFVDMFKSGKKSLWKDVHKQHRNTFALMQKRLYGIEHDADKRLLMGDDLKNPSDRFYGNSLLQAKGCDHGTFVAGVIAGQGINNAAITGVWPQARLMIIRAVPDGDEYDKDISTAIRYAVDNGAKVINMSLGKYTSPDADMVNEAIEYALKKDVLIIQAAGNNKRNIDLITYFPSAKDAQGKIFPNYLRVGSSDKKGQLSQFSNYGAKEVDVFAPGEEITSVTVGNKYMVSQGTSIATPIVSGVAAMLRAHFPKLTATQIKEILIKSVRPADNLKDRCTSGGIIDALQAVKLAIEYKKR